MSRMTSNSEFSFQEYRISPLNLEPLTISLYTVGIKTNYKYKESIMKERSYYCFETT